MLRISDSKRILLFQVYPVWRHPATDMRLPLGMLYMGSSLKKSGYDVEVFHIEENELDAELSRIDLNNVLFIAVCSIMTGYSLRSAISFSKKNKLQHPCIPVIWGGVQPTAIPEVCLKEDFVDAVGMGEGEELIVDIAKMLNGLLAPHEVKGLAFKDDAGNIIVNERREFIRNLDDYQVDYSLIDLNRYIFYGNITGLIMSSRGCAFNCAFCYNNAFNNGRWRKHSLEYVLNVLQELRVKYQFKGFSFSDDNFFVDRKRAIKILEEVHKLGLQTYSVDIKINHITDEDIEALGEYGVGSVFFGTESLNFRLINLINKKQTKEMVVDVISKFSKYAPNVPVQTEILMALPFERKSELRRDIKEGLDLYRHNKNLSVYFGVLFPLPKTKMMEYANINGFCPQNIDDYANIDLNTAWSICDQWTLFDLTDREKRKLYLTEKYSALLAYDRRLKSNSLISILEYIKINAVFKLAKFRVTHWFFLFYKLDFLISKLPVHKISNLLYPFAFLYRKTIKKINRSVSYINFGYIPGDPIIQNLQGKLFGAFNLLKRLQAKGIMNALDVKPSEVVLDFGCGSGYMTIELAKLAKKAYGIDINEYIEKINIPSILQGRLKYIRVSGEKFPFQDNFFDTILASEILPMIPDPKKFLAEIRRVLKPNGRLVISNGAGHPVIRNAFKEKRKFFKWLKKRYPERMPESYEKYCSILQESFGTAQKKFFSENDIRDLLIGNGFLIESIDYTPGYLAGAYFSWSQFLLYLRKGKTTSQHAFVLKYFLFSMLRLFETRKYRGGLLCVAKNNKSDIKT